MPKQVDRTVKDVDQMDRGWSWVVMVAAFLAFFMTDGIIFCFGLVMSELMVYLEGSPTKIAWVYSVLSGMTMLAGYKLSTIQ